MKFRKILSYLVLAVGKGVGKGFGGDIKVEVHLKDDAIVDVKIIEHSETEGISNVAREEMPKRIVENQSYNVDTVSGATYSSNGIKDAVKDALKTKGLDDKFSNAVSETKIEISWDDNATINWWIKCY